MLIMSVGGGKGGVGKSMVCANLAVQYAKAGLRVVILDLDFGAANLHTIFGMRQPAKSLGDYFRVPRSRLSDYLVDTEVQGLRLAPCSGCVPELANLHHAVRSKLMRQIRKLDADLVLLDLGAGSAYNVIDFFASTDMGVLVTTPEPTAILNTYEFLKNVVHRNLTRLFRKQPQILQIVHAKSDRPVTEVIAAIREVSPWLGELAADSCGDLNLHMVFNQARSRNDAALGLKLRGICENHLSLQLNYAGMIYYNEKVSSSVLKMRPISLSEPLSATSQALQGISRSILDPKEFAEQLASVQREADNSFAANRLEQHRERRAERVQA